MGDQGGPADQMLEADEMDIDNELQVAIMLSMQQVSYNEFMLRQTNYLKTRPCFCS